jgi:hypothetical protein
MPIAIASFNLEEYRQYFQALSDDDVIKESKKLRWLSGDGRIVSTIACAFYEQLKICREEDRRRHPKL